MKGNNIIYHHFHQQFLRSVVLMDETGIYSDKTTNL